MEFEDIHQAVASIRDAAKDPEKAHALEDELFIKFIGHVANQPTALGEMAREVLKTSEIQFPRHCA